jgi:hypothetical protein
MESIIGLYKNECIATTVFHDGPYKPLADIEYATPAGSTGTTTDACTARLGCSPQPSTSSTTTLLTAVSHNPHESGTEPVTVHPDAWRTLTDTRDVTDSGEENLEAFIAAAVEAAPRNAEAREALGPALDHSPQTLTPPPSPQPSRTSPPATTRLRHYPTSIRTRPPSWKRSAVGSPDPRMTDGFRLTDRIVGNDEFVTPGQGE